jgi:hypothetical protein
MRYAGDDYVLVDTHDAPNVYSLHGTAKLERHHVKTFPELQARVSDISGPDDEKSIVYIEEEDGLARSLPLRAIVAPIVTGREGTRVHPISGQEALRAAAPSTILQLSGYENISFGRLASLVRRLPTFRLDLGTDIDTIAPAVRRLLQELP